MSLAPEPGLTSPHRRPARPHPAVEFVLAGNGPGELRGWIAPVARAVRALVPAHAEAVRLTLALTPSQFAGGREVEVVRSWRLFDRILDPRACLRLAAGLDRVSVVRPGVLIHLGGDLMLSAQLARALRIPACALAETTLVARRHRPFDRVLAATETVADALRSGGVPASKVVVTGDPRSDALPALEAAPHGPREHGRLTVSYMAGSRDRFFTILGPFFLETARSVAQRGLQVHSQFIVSEFLTPALVDTVKAQAARSGAPPVEWVSEQGWEAVARSDFVVTIPGTNTLELAMAGIPLALVVPTQHIAWMPVEGGLEWIARLPGLGAPLRRLALRTYLRRHQFLAIPNQRAGRLVVPEWIGALEPDAVAARTAAVLQDSTLRADMAASLRSLHFSQPGSAGRVVAEALHVAAPSLLP